jgi:polar amino acid transport system substrate-binding protein
MKKLILAAAAALIALTGAASAQTVRLASEGAYAPWNFIDDSGNLAGFEIDLGNELCKRAQLECVWIQNAWDSMIPNLNAGNFDGIMAGMSITDERKQSIDFTQNYKPPTPSTFIVQSASTATFEAPSGLRIGTQTATIQAAYAEQHFKDGNTLINFETTDQGLADLNAGNIDAFFIERDFLAEVAAGSGGALKLAPPEIPIGDGVGVGLRKTDDELEKKLNDAISSMKKDGSLSALIVQWFPEQGPGPYYAEEAAAN